jgi:hypothetical protein
MAFWSKFRRARESNEELASSVDTPEPSQGLQKELTRRLLEYVRSMCEHVPSV